MLQVMLTLASLFVAAYVVYVFVSHESADHSHDHAGRPQDDSHEI